jgi:hypothetical protein
MDQLEGMMDDGVGTYWDRGGGDSAPHSPAIPDTQGGVIPGAPCGEGYMHLGSVATLSKQKPTLQNLDTLAIKCMRMPCVTSLSNLTRPCISIPPHLLFLLFPLSRVLHGKRCNQGRLHRAQEARV